MFTLEYKGKRVDLSSTVSVMSWLIIAFLSTQIWQRSITLNIKVRFSGIPNNGTLELVELSRDEICKEEKVGSYRGCLRNTHVTQSSAGDCLPPTSLWSTNGGRLHPSHFPNAGFIVSLVLSHSDLRWSPSGAVRQETSPLEKRGWLFTPDKRWWATMPSTTPPSDP